MFESTTSVFDKANIDSALNYILQSDKYQFCVTGKHGIGKSYLLNQLKQRDNSAIFIDVDLSNESWSSDIKKAIKDITTGQQNAHYLLLDLSITPFSMLGYSDGIYEKYIYPFAKICKKLGCKLIITLYPSELDFGQPKVSSIFDVINLGRIEDTQEFNPVLFL